jgi:hypothetical protein
MQPEAVTRTLRELEAEGIHLPGIPRETLVEAIGRACRSASDVTPIGQGCFVRPL